MKKNTKLKNNTKKNKKLEIIQKSIEIVARMGYKKSSTEEIAKALDKTKGSLYYYFKSKDDLIKAVIEYESDQLKNEIMNAIKKTDDPRIKLKLFYKVRAIKILKLLSFYKLVLNEYFDRYTFIMTTLKSYNKEESATIKSILKNGSDSGLFAISELDKTARAIIKTMHGFDFFMFLEGDREENLREMREILKIIIKGISK